MQHLNCWTREQKERKIQPLIPQRSLESQVRRSFFTAIPFSLRVWWWIRIWWCYTYRSAKKRKTHVYFKPLCCDFFSLSLEHKTRKCYAAPAIKKQKQAKNDSFMWFKRLKNKVMIHTLIGKKCLMWFNIEP